MLIAWRCTLRTLMRPADVRPRLHLVELLTCCEARAWEGPCCKGEEWRAATGVVCAEAQPFHHAPY